MPTHWESSTRPLFVKTVVVNGSRHAILTQEDPLGHAFAHANSKTSRPNSPQSNTSDSSGDTRDYRDKRVVDEKGQHPPDLQSCLVRLRVVLANQDNRRPVNSTAVKQTAEPAIKKRKHLKQGCRRFENADASAQMQLPVAKVVPVTTQHLEIEHSVAVANFFTESKSQHMRNSEVADRIEGCTGPTHYQCDLLDCCSTAPTLGMSVEYDTSWNSVSAENYFTRPFYNRLSERVLHWMDLSARNNPKPANITEVLSPRKLETKTNHLQITKKLMHRQCSEETSDEVRTDEDVETALSMELPKFSQDLNRQHKIKIVSHTPQEEPCKSSERHFKSITSIRSGKYSITPKQESLPSEKLKKTDNLTKQLLIEESSDVDIWERQHLPMTHHDHFKYLKKVSGYIDKEGIKLTHEGSRVLRRGGLEGIMSGKEGKPQLHIFMPAIPQDKESDGETENEKCIEKQSLNTIMT